MKRRTYSPRERFLFACLVPISGAVEVLLVYIAMTVDEVRRDVLFWFALIANLAAIAICLKIATTGTAKRHLEQDADARAGRSLDDTEHPRPGSMVGRYTGRD